MQIIYDEYTEKMKYEEKFNNYKESIWTLLPNFNEYYKNQEILLKLKFLKESKFDPFFYEERKIVLDQQELPLFKDCIRLIDILETKIPVHILKEEAEFELNKIRSNMREYQEEVIPKKNIKIKEQCSQIYSLEVKFQEADSERNDLLK